MFLNRTAIVWIAVGASLALRLAYFSQIRGNPYFDVPIMDEGYHDLWAREIANGEWKTRLPFFRAPLYPFLMGLAYRVFGSDPAPFSLLRAWQLLLGASTPWFAHRIARRLAPTRPAIAGAAALLVALDGILIYFEAELLLESLLAPLSAALVLLLLRAGSTGSVSRWFGVGLVLGLFAIIRPNVLLFAPVLFLGVLGWTQEGWSLRARRFGPALALTIGTCLPVLPVTAVNTWIGGDRVLVSSQAGLNFFLGNNAEANGWSATAPSIMSIDWWGGYEDSIRLAEEARGRELKPSEVSSYWFERSFEWWRENPGDGLRVTLRKAAFFFSGLELSNNRDIPLFFREFAPLGSPSLALYYVVMPFSALGVVLFWRRRDPGARLVVLYVAVYAASIVAFFVTARYRVPLRPILAIFAVAGAFHAVDSLRSRGVRGALPLAAVLILGVAANVNPWVRSYVPTAGQFFQSVANVYYQNGEFQDALRWQLRALDSDPGYPKGNLNLGAMYLALGEPAKAVEALQRERRLDPDDGEALATLGTALMQVGRIPDAAEAFGASADAGLRDARALYNLGLCLERLERPAEAESAYLRAVEIDSTFVDSWINLGVLQARAGNFEDAISRWERAMRMHPEDPRLLDNLRRARERLEERRGEDEPQ